MPRLWSNSRLFEAGPNRHLRGVTHERLCSGLRCDTPVVNSGLRVFAEDPNANFSAWLGVAQCSCRSGALWCGQEPSGPVVVAPALSLLDWSHRSDLDAVVTDPVQKLVKDC